MSVTPNELERMLKEKTAIVVDVRSSGEFTEGHIEGATHIPIESLPGDLKNVSSVAQIVTVCNQGGGRSERAAEFLRSQGWLNTSWLEGGYFGWRDLGLARVEVGEASS